MQVLTIGAVAKAAEVGVETIRFYEREGLIAPPPRRTQPPVAATRAEVMLDIDGMACEACASRIEQELRDMDGVHEASVEFAKTRARVVFDPGRVTATASSAAVDALGFENRIAQTH